MPLASLASRPSARYARVGDVLAFAPGYGALLAAMTSPYVEKRLLGGEA